MKKTLSILVLAVIAIGCYAQDIPVPAKEENNVWAVILSVIAVIVMLVSIIFNITKTLSRAKQTLFLVFIQLLCLGIAQRNIPWGSTILAASIIHLFVFAYQRIRDSRRQAKTTEDEQDETYNYNLLLQITEEILNENDARWQHKEELQDHIRSCFGTIRKRYIAETNDIYMYIDQYTEGIIQRLADSIYEKIGLKK